MLSTSQAEDRVAALIASARQAGADAADAIYVCNASTQVQVRLGALEDVERSEGEEIGLRFFVGSRSASVSSSDLSGDALAALVERADEWGEFDRFGTGAEDQQQRVTRHRRPLSGNDPALQR